MKRPKTIFLCDVDEVLADFSGRVFQLLDDMGEPRKPITSWDLFEPYSDAVNYALRHEISKPGFCANLPVRPGARDFIENLRRRDCEVFAVTSPWNSPTWEFERRAWLNTYFGINKAHVVSTSAKHLVCPIGSIFMDDSPEHVNARPMGSMALLLSTDFNENHGVLLHDFVSRVADFAEALAHVMYHTGGPR